MQYNYKNLTSEGKKLLENIYIAKFEFDDLYTQWLRHDRGYNYIVDQIWEFLIGNRVVKLLEILREAILQKYELDGFRFCEGSLHRFDSKDKNYRDWGTSVYQYTFGSKDTWKKWIEDCWDYWKSENKKDFEKVKEEMIGESVRRSRIYYYEEATSKILKERKKTGSLVYEPTGTQSIYYTMRKDYPFILIPFPIVHFPIWDGNDPIGFFTIRLGKSDYGLIDKIKDKEFILKIKEIFQKDKLEEKASVELRSEINFYFMLLADSFFCPILRATKRAKETIENKDILKTIFSHKLINAVDNETKNLGYYDAIEEFIEYYGGGFCEPEELCMKLVYELWSERYKKYFIKGDTFDIFKDLQEAQRALFWIDEYREHFIHSLKVFLLGSLFVSCVLKNDKLTRFLNEKHGLDKEKFEFAWAAASTFHDVAISIEKINPLIKKILQKFAQLPELDEDDYERYNSARDLLNSRTVQYLHLLHSLDILFHQDFQKNVEGLSRQIHLVEYSDFISNRKVLDSEIFKYYKKYSDHGIASAIIFMAYSMFGLGAESEVLLKNEKQVDEIKKRYNVCFLIADAIMRHHFIFDEKFKSKHKRITFPENPIAFLLALADQLQDWGRPVGEKGYVNVEDEDKKKKYRFFNRPIGEFIDFKRDGETIEIFIEYKWYGYDETERKYISIDFNKCKNEKFLRKYPESKNKLCEGWVRSETCDECHLRAMECIRNYWGNVSGKLQMGKIMGKAVPLKVKVKIKVGDEPHIVTFESV